MPWVACRQNICCTLRRTSPISLTTYSAVGTKLPTCTLLLSSIGNANDYLLIGLAVSRVCAICRLPWPVAIATFPLQPAPHTSWVAPEGLKGTIKHPSLTTCWQALGILNNGVKMASLENCSLALFDYTITQILLPWRRVHRYYTLVTFRQLPTHPSSYTTLLSQQQSVAKKQMRMILCVHSSTNSI